MLAIHTNTAALAIQRYLRESERSTDRSIERLSSGLRINSARDDAAGLAVATRIEAISRGQKVALRNTNDAISYAQVGDGALSSLADTLQRMRELAVQSANPIYADTDHQALNAEFVQLQHEITRITSKTEFNGLSLFDGTARVFHIDGDASANSRLSFQGKDLIADTSKTGLAAFINNGVTQATVNAATGAYIAGGGTFSTADGSPDSGGSLGGTIAAFESNISATDLSTFADAKAAFFASGGRFDASTGNPVMAKSGTTTVIINPGPSQTTQVIAVATASDISSYNDFVAARQNYYAAAKGIQILDAPSAQSAIITIDNALDEIGQERSKHGAFLNLLSGVVSYLDTSITSESATRSRITDADYAAETAALATSRILQQAGQAMLAQANQLPNMVLMLLRG